MEKFSKETMSSPEFADVPREELSQRLEQDKTTLESLKTKDSQLRTQLEGDFPDDDDFHKGVEEAVRYLTEVNSSNREGIEQARSLAAAEKMLKDLFKTGRGKASGDFIELGEKIEKTEEEVRQLHRILDQ